MGMPVPKPNHKRRVPKRKNRGKFGAKERKEIKERDEGKCRQCGTPASQVHHIFLRSQGGRGVVSNGMVVCNDCHTQIHQDNSLKEYWQRVFAEHYGSDYHKDEWDL